MELGVGYNVCKLEPKSKSHQFAGFLGGLPTFIFIFETGPEGPELEGYQVEKKIKAA